MNATAVAPAAGLSPDRIMQLGTWFRASKVLLSAVELGLFTELARGPLDRETLRCRLGLHLRSAQDFFDVLVALGILDRRGGIYANTREADIYLDRAKPSYIGGVLELANARLFPSWCSLTQALRTGEPAGRASTGRELFDEIYADPDRLETFLRDLIGLSLPPAQALAQKFPWRRYQSVIDIGTGGGVLPATLASAHQHLTGGGFDLPVVGRVFERYVRERGLADRLRFYPGDFFEQPLPSADVLVMGHILHDWDLPTKRDLLAKAHAALPTDGVLIVYDQMIDDDRRENVSGLLMSLSMLMETPGGFDYRWTECVTWVREAGFTAARREHLQGPYSIVVGVK